MKIITLLLFILPLSVSAKEVWHTSEINRIYPLSNGGFVLTFKNQSDACKNGSNSKYHYVMEGENGVTKEAIVNLLSVSLTAASLGKKITINFDDSTNSCFINRLFVEF